jgi:Uma2 family endonuclease
MSTNIAESIPKYDVSYEDWLATAPDSRMSEWVNGRVIEFMPPTERHQDLLVWLVTLLNLYVRQARLGKVIAAPFEMRLEAVSSSREPDILVVLNANLHRLDGKRLNGPADLAVEILSPDSVARDRRDKLAEYAAAGVPEFWIIDPRLGRYSFKVHRLNDERYYEEVTPNAKGLIDSVIVSGFFVNPRWVELDPLPDPISILSEMPAASSSNS